MSRSPRFARATPRLPGFAGLTPRQLEVVEAKCLRGMTSRQIAEQWSISPTTVKNHMTDVYDHLELPNEKAVCFNYALWRATNLVVSKNGI